MRRAPKEQGIVCLISQVSRTGEIKWQPLFYFLFCFCGVITIVTVITNNPLIKHQKNYALIFVPEVDQVLLHTRDMIHQGGKLLIHPLYGNFKEDQMHYRTLIVSSGNVLDYRSLIMVENAIEKISRPKTPLSDQMAQEWQTIDKYLIMEVIGNLSNSGQ